MQRLVYIKIFIIIIIYHINRSKEKHHMIISRDSKKVCSKIQHPFRLRNQAVKKIEIIEYILHMIKIQV